MLRKDSKWNTETGNCTSSWETSLDEGAMTLWTRNLSLHCMSGGASRCACIVTANTRPPKRVLTPTSSPRRSYQNIKSRLSCVNPNFWGKKPKISDTCISRRIPERYDKDKDKIITGYICTAVRLDDASIGTYTILFGRSRLDLKRSEFPCNQAHIHEIQISQDTSSTDMSQS